MLVVAHGVRQSLQLLRFAKVRRQADCLDQSTRRGFALVICTGPEPWFSQLRQRHVDGTVDPILRDCREQRPHQLDPGHGVGIRYGRLLSPILVHARVRYVERRCRTARANEDRSSAAPRMAHADLPHHVRVQGRKVGDHHLRGVDRTQHRQVDYLKQSLGVCAHRAVPCVDQRRQDDALVRLVRLVLVPPSRRGRGGDQRASPQTQWGSPPGAG